MTVLRPDRVDLRMLCRSIWSDSTEGAHRNTFARSLITRGAIPEAGR
jgi:hypothetical protein